jgi:hypothetical protein
MKWVKILVHKFASCIKLGDLWFWSDRNYRTWGRGQNHNWTSLNHTRVCRCIQSMTSISLSRRHREILWSLECMQPRLKQTIFYSTLQIFKRFNFSEFNMLMLNRSFGVDECLNMGFLIINDVVGESSWSVQIQLLGSGSESLKGDS